MTNFETGTRNTMMWRVPWASATGGHTDQIVEMLDVYPCADPPQAPFALEGEGSTVFEGSKNCGRSCGQDARRARGPPDGAFVQRHGP